MKQLRRPQRSSRNKLNTHSYSTNLKFPHLLKSHAKKHENNTLSLLPIQVELPQTCQVKIKTEMTLEYPMSVEDQEVTIELEAWATMKPCQGPTPSPSYWNLF